ncbi:MAG: translation initiation factor IF-2 [Bdellovibrionales bacterium]|nr:translation initiation factor IF-2 [Bdellovibrionales bacterium]
MSMVVDSKDKVVTEERVTKKVIRRRATTQTAESQSEAVEEASAKDESISVASNELENVQVQEEITPAKASKKIIKKAKEADDFDDAYRKLKVVAKKEVKEPVLQIKSFPEGQEAQTQSYQTDVPTLTKKEIIDVRNMNRAKGGRKRKAAPGAKAKKTEITTPKAAKRVLKIGDTISVQELAKNMSIKAPEVIKKLLGMGMMATINQTLDVDTATLVASEFEFEVENITVAPDDLLVQVENEENINPGDEMTRPPIVTVMGHVDHGKTTLLDSIRKSDVAGGEAGGITQAIGAYTVQTSTGHKITFIDTPGHESFTAMRARGAKVTDIVILVVAADDGVMPQTKEAVNHAKSAGVPILVAVNKIDKPGADLDKIKKQLTEFEMVPEEWGGDTIYVPVSAKTGKGIDELLEHIGLQSELLELKANPKRSAKGVVIESRVDKGRGVITSLLVLEGTLKVGDTIISGSEFGRVRDMRDDKSAQLKDASPSQAVEVTGLSGIASAGDEFSVVTNERKAKQIAEMRKNIEREKELAASSKVSLDDLYQKIEEGEVKDLNVIIKADTDGSIEVLKDAMVKLSTKKVNVKVIHGAVGGITENDVLLASASGALIVGFNIRPQSGAKKLAEQKGIEIRLYRIIYELQEDIKNAMVGLLAPKIVEETLGMAEVREVYSISKLGNIAGCLVQEGRITRDAKVRLIRDDVVVYTGDLSSLKRFKDDAKEVKSGTECGIGIKNYNDIKVGDFIEAFAEREEAAELE